MKFLAIVALSLPLLSGCISSSSPPAPQKSTTTVVVPQDTKTVVVCSDGTRPPCP